MRSLLLVAVARAAFAQDSATEEAARCLALGFAPGLQCKSCDRLGALLEGDEALVADCRACCAAEAADSASAKASHARLEVCQ